MKRKITAADTITVASKRSAYSTGQRFPILVAVDGLGAVIFTDDLAHVERDAVGARLVDMTRARHALKCLEEDERSLWARRIAVQLCKGDPSDVAAQVGGLSVDDVREIMIEANGLAVFGQAAITHALSVHLVDRHERPRPT